MTLDELKAKITWIGAERLNEFLKAHPGELVLRDSYNVTFEDPSKPALTVWARRLHQPGDSFMVDGVRRTSANAIIFRGRLHNPAPVYDPKIKSYWTRVEFTLTALRDDRMNASAFLTQLVSLMDRITQPADVERIREDIERGDVWGSW